MSPAAKSISKKIAELAELKAKLEAAQQEIQSSKESIVDQIKHIFDKNLIEEMKALEIKKVIVTISPDGEIKIDIGESEKGGSNGNHSNGHTEIAEGTVVERKYKEQTYTMRSEAGSLNVYCAGSLLGSYSSPTAAAQAVVGSKKSLNGRAWWGVK